MILLQGRLLFILLICVVPFGCKQKKPQWLEITMVSGNLKDWKLFLSKGSQQSGTVVQAGKWSLQSSAGVNVLAMKVNGKGSYHSPTKRTAARQRVQTVHLPNKLFLSGHASIRGNEIKRFATLPQPGHSVSWNKRFLINTHVNQDMFLTVEIKAFYQGKQFSVGTKTVRIGALHKGIGERAFKLHGGSLRVLVRAVRPGHIKKLKAAIAREDGLHRYRFVQTFKGAIPQREGGKKVSRRKRKCKLGRIIIDTEQKRARVRFKGMGYITLPMRSAQRMFAGFHTFGFLWRGGFKKKRLRVIGCRTTKYFCALGNKVRCTVTSK